ncbi:Anillin-like proteiny domain [Sesbania bispinosa]|nr:Anillin-like proteiny domain [Sesbania bispinosa]
MATAPSLEGECGDAVGTIGVRDGVGVTDSVAMVAPPVISGENTTGTSSSLPEIDAKGKAPIRVRKGRGKGKGSTTDVLSSRPPVVEKKFNGYGSMSGYIVKADFEDKEESSYDFITYSWVDPFILDTQSVYRSQEETIAFTQQFDFVRKDFDVTVECSWCAEDDKLSKMSPKLDKSTMARHIVEKRKEAEKKRKRSESSEIHMISDDEQRSENVVDVFQELAGSSTDVRSLWDSRFDFGKLIDAECSLPGDQNQLDKWGPRSAHVLLQIQGIRSAYLGRYLKLQHMKEVSEVELSQLKVDKKVVDVALLQEKIDHEATRNKSIVDRDQLSAEAANSGWQNVKAAQVDIPEEKGTEKVNSDGGMVQTEVGDEVLGDAPCN